LEWLRALPVELVEANPWVRYWAGASQVAVAPSQARDQLARAHDAAAERGDVMCQVQCAAAIVESCCIEWTRFSLMDPWIPMLERAIDEKLPWPSADAHLRAMNALLSALAYRCPEHDLLPLCVERTLTLLSSAADPNIKVVAASTLTNHGGHSAQPRIVRAGLLLLEQWIDDPAVAMPNRGAGLFSLIWGRHCFRDLTGARAAVEALESLADESGLTYLGTFSAFMGANVEGAYGDMSLARRWFEKLRERTHPSRWYDRAVYCCTAVWMGMYERNPKLALTYGAEGIALIADGVANSAIQWRFPVAVAHAHRGDAAAVQRLLAEIRGFMDKHRLKAWGALCRAAEAILALRLLDREALVRALADMLHLQHGLEEANLWYLRADLPEIFSAALAENIDPDEVRRLIRAFGVPAPTVLADPWPWPVRIRALGTFSIEIDDAPLVFKGKVPKKPLSLLKALICFGASEVPISRLADALWPDLDGDDALRAFHTALFRLRALLRYDNLLVLSDGRLTLDRHRTWVDAMVFQELCAAAMAKDIHAAHRARSLYAGAFLEGEPDSLWAIEIRTRMERMRRSIDHGLSNAREASVISFPSGVRSVNDR
jgi:LuxR family transcriptional regulator, maltose regulon positive regulatory protein